MVSKPAGHKVHFNFNLQTEAKKRGLAIRRGPNFHHIGGGYAPVAIESKNPIKSKYVKLIGVMGDGIQKRYFYINVAPPEKLFRKN